jgi:serine/threonine protein phosphatase PrpC
LAEFDRWVPPGRLAGWRVRVLRSHRWAFLASAAFAMGVIATGYSSMAALSTGLPGMNPGTMLSLSFTGFLAGALLVGPLWGHLSRRVLAFGFLGLLAAGYVVFAVAASGVGPVVAMVSAVVVGFATSAFPYLQKRTQDWIADTTEARRANKTDKARLGSSLNPILGAVGGVLTAGVFTLPVLLPAAVAALVTAGLTVLAVVGLWVTMPPDLPSPTQTQHASLKNLVITSAKSMFGALNSGFVWLVASLFGLTAFIQSSFNAFWREALDGFGAGDGLLMAVLNWGVVVGFVGVLLLLVPADWRSYKTGKRVDPLGRGAAAFLLVMAGFLAVGSVGVAATAFVPVLGGPVAGIAIAAFLIVIANQGVGLGVNGIFRRHMPGPEGGSALSATIVTSALAGLAGAQLATQVWNGNTPLPGGWHGVAIQIAASSLLAFGIAVRLARHRGPSTTAAATRHRGVSRAATAGFTRATIASILATAALAGAGAGVVAAVFGSPTGVVVATMVVTAIVTAALAAAVRYFRVHGSLPGVPRALRLIRNQPARGPPPALRPTTVEQLRAAILRQRDQLDAVSRLQWTMSEQTLVNALLARLDRIADELATHQPGTPEHTSLLSNAHTALARLETLTNPSQDGSTSSPSRAVGRWVGEPSVQALVAAVLLVGGVGAAAAVGWVPVAAGFVAFAVGGSVNLFRGLRWGTSPGWVRLWTAVIVVSWVVNLVIHVPGTISAVVVGDWWSAAVNGLFAVADVLFLAAALPAWATAWFRTPDVVNLASPEVAARRVARVLGWTLRWLAFPVITTAVWLLAVQLAVLGPWGWVGRVVAVIPLVVLGAGFGYLSARGVATRPGRGDSTVRTQADVRAAFAAGIGLASYGLARLWLDHVVAGVGITAALGVTALLLWILHKRRGPPPAGTSVLSTGPSGPSSGLGVLRSWAARHPWTVRIAVVVLTAGALVLLLAVPAAAATVPGAGPGGIGPWLTPAGELLLARAQMLVGHLDEALAAPGDAIAEVPPDTGTAPDAGTDTGSDRGAMTPVMALATSALGLAGLATVYPALPVAAGALAIAALATVAVRRLVGGTEPGMTAGSSGAGSASGDSGPEAAMPEQTTMTDAHAVGDRASWQPLLANLVNVRAAWTVVLLAGGLVAALVAVRYGVAVPGVLAAGALWWPGRGNAARERRELAAEAGRPSMDSVSMRRALRAVVVVEGSERRDIGVVVGPRLVLTDARVVGGAVENLRAGGVPVAAVVVFERPGVAGVGRVRRWLGVGGPPGLALLQTVDELGVEAAVVRADDLARRIGLFAVRFEDGESHVSSGPMVSRLGRTVGVRAGIPPRVVGGLLIDFDGGLAGLVESGAVVNFAGPSEIRAVLDRGRRRLAEVPESLARLIEHGNPETSVELDDVRAMLAGYGIAATDEYLAELITHVVISRVVVRGNTYGEELLDRRAQALLDRLSRLAAQPGSGPQSDRALLIGAWNDLFRSLAGIGMFFGYSWPDRRARVQEILGRLRHELSAGPPADRVALIGAAAAELGSLHSRWLLNNLGEFLADLRHPPQSRLLEALLWVYRDAGAGSAGTAAFEEAWLDSLEYLHRKRPFPLRLWSPEGVVYRVDGTEMIVDVVRDPVEIEYIARDIAGDTVPMFVLNPDVAVIAAWERRRDGGRGERLATLAVVQANLGLLPLSDRVDVGGHVGVGRAFGEFLQGWAELLGQPLLVTSGQARALAIDVSSVSAVEWELTVGGVRVTPSRIWSDVLGGTQALPGRFNVVGHRMFDKGSFVELYHGSRDNRSTIASKGFDPHRTVFLTRDFVTASMVASRGTANSGVFSFRVPSALFEKYLDPLEEPDLVPESGEERWGVTQFPLRNPELIVLINHFMNRPGNPLTGPRLYAHPLLVGVVGVSLLADGTGSAWTDTGPMVLLDALPAWLETILQLGLVGAVVAAVVWGARGIVRLVRQRGPPTRGHELDRARSRLRQAESLLVTGDHRLLRTGSRRAGAALMPALLLVESQGRLSDVLPAGAVVGLAAAAVTIGALWLIKALTGGRTIRAPTWLRRFGGIAAMTVVLSPVIAAGAGMSPASADAQREVAGGGSVAAASRVPDAVLSEGTQLRLVGQETVAQEPAGSARRGFTAYLTDRAGEVAGALLHLDGRPMSFEEFNAANGGRFSGPDERIGGQPVFAPADWSGVWITLPGDSYWRIYVERFGDLDGWRRAVARDRTPDLIEPGVWYRIQRAPPSTPGKPEPGTPGPGTAEPGPQVPSSPPASPSPGTGSPPAEPSPSPTRSPSPGSSSPSPAVPTSGSPTMSPSPPASVGAPTNAPEPSAPPGGGVARALGWLWGQRSWLGPVVVVAAALRGLRGLQLSRSERRLKLIETTQPMPLEPRNLAAVDVWRLLVWLGRYRAEYQEGVPAGQLTNGATWLGVEGHPLLAELADWIAAQKRPIYVVRLVQALAGVGMPLFERTPDDHYKVAGPLADLLDRLPDAVVDGLLANPATALRLDADDVVAMSAEEFANALFAELTVLAFAQNVAHLRSGWRAWLPIRRMPLRLQPERRAERQEIVSDVGVRDAGKAIERQRALPRLQKLIQREHELAARRASAGRHARNLWGLGLRAHHAIVLRLLRRTAQRHAVSELVADPRKLGRALADFDEKLERLERDQILRVRRAKAIGAARGFTRGQMTLATIRASNVPLLPFLLGMVQAMAGEKLYSVADEDVAGYYGLHVEFVKSLGPTLGLIAAPVSFVFSLFNMRMIAMPVLGVLTAVGLLGLFAVSLGGGSFGFVMTSVVWAVWDATSGLLRARLEWRYPLIGEFQARRSGLIQTAFKVGQMTVGLSVIGGFAVLGVGATAVALWVGFGAIAVALLWKLRGQPQKARAPPRQNAAKTGAQSRAPKVRAPSPTLWRTSRSQAARVLFSMTIGGVLAGWPFAALVGGMAPTFVRANLGASPSPWLVGAISASAAMFVLTFVSRALAAVSGAWWKQMRDVLGARGVLERMRGRSTGKLPVDDGLVLVRLAVLSAVVQILAAAAMWLWPGLWTFGGLLVVTAVITGLIGTPLIDWTAGPRGTSLVQAARAGSVSAGPIVAGWVVNAAAGSATDAIERHAGLGTVRELVQDLNGRVFGLAVAIGAALVVWAVGVWLFRVAPVSTLHDRLPEHLADEIIRKAKEAGIPDVGTAVAAREILRNALTDKEFEALAPVLSAPTPLSRLTGATGRVARSGVRLLGSLRDGVVAGGSWLLGWLRDRVVAVSVAVWDATAGTAGAVVVGVTAGLVLGGGAWLLGLDLRLAAGVAIVTGPLAALLWTRIRRPPPPGGPPPGGAPSGPAGPATPAGPAGAGAASPGGQASVSGGSAQGAGPSVLGTATARGVAMSTWDASGRSAHAALERAQSQRLNAIRAAVATAAEAGLSERAIARLTGLIQAEIREIIVDSRRGDPGAGGGIGGGLGPTPPSGPTSPGPGATGGQSAGGAAELRARVRGLARAWMDGSLRVVGTAAERLRVAGAAFVSVLPNVGGSALRWLHLRGGLVWGLDTGRSWPARIGRALWAWIRALDARSWIVIALAATGLVAARHGADLAVTGSAAGFLWWVARIGPSVEPDADRPFERRYDDEARAPPLLRWLDDVARRSVAAVLAPARFVAGWLQSGASRRRLVEVFLVATDAAAAGPLTTTAAGSSTTAGPVGWVFGGHGLATVIMTGAVAAGELGPAGLSRDGLAMTSRSAARRIQRRVGWAVAAFMPGAQGDPRVAREPVAHGSGDRSGLRLPHGSQLDERRLALLLTGDPMTAADQAVLADRLEERLRRTTPPETFLQEAELLREMVLVTIQLLRGQRLGRRWRGVGPVGPHWLAEAVLPLLVDPILGSGADAGYRTTASGVPDTFARDEVGLLYAVVRSALAPHVGFGPEESSVLAVLAERMVDGPDRVGEPWKGRPRWLTARAERGLDELAARNPAARVLQVWGDERVGSGIRFADGAGWRSLELRYRREFRDAAVERAEVPRLDDSELRAEYENALAGLRQLVAGDRELSRGQRRSMYRALRRTERVEGGPRRWDIEVELRHLRAGTERAGVWPTDSELVYLAVRNVTWARHTRAPELMRVRFLAAEALLETASSDLRPIMRLAQPGGDWPVLLEVVAPAIGPADATGNDTLGSSGEPMAALLPLGLLSTGGLDGLPLWAQAAVSATAGALALVNSGAGRLVARWARLVWGWIIRAPPVRRLMLWATGSPSFGMGDGAAYAASSASHTISAGPSTIEVLTTSGLTTAMLVSGWIAIRAVARGWTENSPPITLADVRAWLARIAVVVATVGLGLFGVPGVAMAVPAAPAGVSGVGAVTPVLGVVVVGVALAGVVIAAIRLVRSRGPPDPLSEHAATVLPIAFDRAGAPLRLGTAARVALRALIDRLEAQGKLEPHNPRRVSPTNQWARQGLAYAKLDGDAELRELLASFGLDGITLVYLIDLLHNRVIVSLRTSGDVLDRGETQRARAVLEQVVARQASRPGATPKRVWRGFDPIEVFIDLLMGQMGAVDTLLQAWGPLIEGLDERAAVTERDTVDEARGVLESVEESLNKIKAFLTGPASRRTDLGELNTRYGQARNQFDQLRSRLASVTDAQRRYAGLTPEQVDLILEFGEMVAGYRDVLAMLTGEPASRREQLRTMLDADADQVAADLTALRHQLADVPAVEAVTELVSSTEQLHARYEQLHNSSGDASGGSGGPMAAVLPLMLLLPAGGLDGLPFWAQATIAAAAALALVTSGAGRVVVRWARAVWGWTTRGPPARTVAVIRAVRDWVTRTPGRMIMLVVVGVLAAGPATDLSTSERPAAASTASVAVAAVPERGAAPVSSTAVTRPAVEGGTVADRQGAGVAAPRWWIVQPGNTLTKLARAFGVSVQAWVDADPGRFPTAASRHRIFVGEPLRIPAGWDGIYRVRPGDTFDEIAESLGVDPDLLAGRQGGRFQTRRSRDHIDLRDRFVLPGTPADKGRPGGPSELPSTQTPPSTPTRPPSVPPSASTSPSTPSSSASPPTMTAPPSVRGPPGGPGFWTVLLVAGVGLIVLTGGVLGFRTLARTVRSRVAVGGGWRALGVQVRGAMERWPDRLRSGRDELVEAWRSGRPRWFAPVRNTVGRWVDTLRAARDGVVAWVQRRGWDLPMLPGRARDAWGQVGWFAYAFGTGIGLAASGPVATMLAAAAVAFGALIAVRVAWSAERLVDPLRDDSWQARQRRAAVSAAAALAGASLGVFATWLPGVVVTAVRALVAMSPATIKFLMAVVVVQGVLNFRYVLHRQTANRELGRRPFARPVRDAVISAAGAAMVMSVYNLMLVVVRWGLHGVTAHLVAGAAAAVAGVLGFGVQRRMVGRERSWTAVMVGVGAVPITVALAVLQVSRPPSSWGDYLRSLAAWMAIVLPITTLVEKLVYRFGRVGLRISDWLYRKATREAARRGAAVGVQRPRKARWLERLAYYRSSFARFGPPDWRILVIKTLTAEIGVVLTHWIARPLYGVQETPWVVTGRVAIAAVLVMATWRWVDRLEIRRGLLGDLTDRSLSPRMRPPFGLLRVTRRIRPYRERLDAFRRHAMGSSAQPDQLPDQELVQKVAENVVRALENLPPMPNLLVELAADPALWEWALRVQELWDKRHAQHQRAVARILLLLASGRPAVGGAADRVGGELRSALRFHVRVLDALLTPVNVERLGLPLDAAQILRGRAEELLIEALKERKRLRVEYLEGYLRLLEHRRDHTLVQRVTAGSLMSEEETEAQLRRVTEEINRVKGQLEVEYAQGIDTRGPVAARLLLRERRDNLREALAAERGALDAPGPRPKREIHKRITAIQRLISALELIESWVALQDEVELHREERKFWRAAVQGAVDARAELTVDTPLGVAFIVAGRDEPTTAEVLARIYPGLAVSWQPLLDALAALSMVSGDPIGGYRAAPALEHAWRKANPQVRHAMVRNPGWLVRALATRAGAQVDETVLEPVTSTDPARWRSIDEGRLAYAALLELFASAERVLFRNHSQGLWDDTIRAWWRWRGARYERRNLEARVNPRPVPVPGAAAPGEPTPQLDVVGKLRDALRNVEQTERRWRRTEIRAHRDRGGRYAHVADANAPPARPDTVTPEQVSAREDRLQAYRQLRDLVQQVRNEVYPMVGSRPGRVSRWLERAERRLARAPGAAGTPLSPHTELRRAARALRIAEPRLKEALEPDSYVAAANAARKALYAYELAARNARAAQIDAQFWPRRRLRRASATADRLRAEAPGLLAQLPVRLDLEATGSVADSGSARADAGDFAFALPDSAAPVVAGVSQAGHTRPEIDQGHNEDQVGAHVEDRTGTITVVAADGLSSGSDSGPAAAAAVKAGLPELIRRDGAGRSAEEAHDDAFALVAAAVDRLAVPGQVNPPATTFTAVRISRVPDGGVDIVIAHVGDTRVIWIPRAGTGEPEVLTRDHTVAELFGATGGAEDLAAWVGIGAPTSSPTIDYYHSDTPGMVIVATDGFHKRVPLDRIAQIIEVNAHRGVVAVRNGLIEELFQHTGAGDDYTLVVVAVN